MILRYVIEEGGQWWQGVGAKAVKLSHQVLPQFAVHKRHSHVLFGGGQELTVVCTLQVELHVLGQEEKILK